MKQKIRNLRIALYFLFEAILAFIVIYSWIFFFGGTIPIGEKLKTGDLTIFVQSNGVHTDLCLPVNTKWIDWRDFIPLTDFPSVKNANYISIGWGDKGFFLDTPEWSDLTISTALNAAFLKSGTAMHVSYLSNSPVESNRVAKVFIMEEDYQQLINYIKNSFQLKDKAIQLIPNRGYWNHDNFYEAEGNYHLFNTCNAWTNRALKEINVKTGWFALSSDGIMRHLIEN